MISRQSRWSSDERGFTLIELMVVVLIIAILLAIAIPTFLGARHRANDRAAQSNARSAHVTELVVYSDNLQFTDVTGDLLAVEGSLSYTNLLADLSPRGRVVYVELLPDVLAPNDTVVVGAKSGSGKCFWIRTTGGLNQLRFADNDCSTVPPTSAYRDEW
jgi:type IV pilus assembly protein PilA